MIDGLSEFRPPPSESTHLLLSKGHQQFGQFCGRPLVLCMRTHYKGAVASIRKKLTSNLRPKIKLRLKRLSLDRMKLLHNEVIFFSVYDHKLVDFGGQIEERRQYFADTDVTVSSLLIEQAHLGHSGNYTCQPAHCPPSSARIHILKGSDGGFSTCSFFSILIKRCSRLWSIGEQPAAMQRSSSTMDASDAALRWRILSVAITFHLCYFHVL